MKLLTFLLLAASQALPQGRTAAAPQQSPSRIEIVLERQEGSNWSRIDPGLILESSDRLRFRFKTNFGGYLYVMNYGTSGHYDLLFPREETGLQNRVEPGRDYQVPATQAWFRVAGPPGHDIVYWMVSPVAFDGGGDSSAGFAMPPSVARPPATLLPRCDDSILRARGLCIDSGAGPRNVADDEQLPENLKHVPRVQSRELTIMRQKESSTVSSPVPLSGPVIYEFRVAHR